MLTIAIPTYNRNTILRDNLRILLPQLTDRVKVLIIDNGSDTPVYESIKSEIASHETQVKLVRNKFNVGLSGNFIKCIETCDTSYMWLLSDDDTPLFNSVGTVLNTLDACSDFVFINFKSEMVAARKTTFETKGLIECVEKIDSFYNFLFFSVGIYNVTRIISNIRVAYVFAYSLSPHLALILSSLGKDGVVIFSDKEVVAPNDVTENALERWSSVTLSLNIITLAELNLKLDERGFKKLGQHLMTHIKNPSFTFKSILRLSDLYENRHVTLHIYEQVYLRSRIFRKSIKDSIQFHIFKYALKFDFILKLVLYLYKRQNRALIMQDRFNRL